MIKLFYYLSMSMVAVLVVVVAYTGWGRMFWVILASAVVAGIFESNKLVKKQLSAHATQRDA